MSKIDFFKFEDNGIDFPFYGTNYFPLDTKMKIIILVLVIIISSLLSGTITGTAIGIFLIASISNWNLSSIFKKPKISDLKVVIPMLILEIVFSLILIIGESFIPLAIVDNPAFNASYNLFEITELIIGLFSEELIKISILLLIAFIIYRFTKNRKLAIGIGSFISLTIFGLLHYPVYYDVLHCLLLGYTSIFTLFTYLKTKNILSCYAVHVIYDCILLIPSILGFI